MDASTTVPLPRYCLGFRKTHTDAIVPKVATGFSAGSDLHALFSCAIHAGDQVEVRTGAAIEFVIRDDEKATELQQLVDSLSKEAEENVQESNNEEIKILSSSLIKTTLRRSKRRKRNVMFKEPVVDKVFGDVIQIKNERFFLKIRSRSGMAANHNINVVGHRKARLTSSNRGEIIVIVVNTGREDFNLEAGMRFAQAVVHLGEALKKEEVFIKYKLLEEEACAPVMEDRDFFGKMPVFLSMDHCLVPPDSSEIVRTGVAISLPNKPCYMQLQSPPLSSRFYAIENSVHTTVQAGVIDADYRGEVKVVLRNDSKDQIFEIEPGMPLAMGVLYDVACPVTRLIGAIGAIEDHIRIDDGRNEINERSPRFINNKSCYLNLSVFRECASSYLMHVQENFTMYKNSARMVRTGVFVNWKELKDTESVLEVQTTPDSVTRVITWKVDSVTAEIMLLVRSKSGDAKHARQGQVLAQVYVCSSPKEGVSLMRVIELDTQKRGTGGFGSTGMN
nr:MAG: dUTPase protein [Hemigrapsus takanoi nimavirus]